MSLPGTDSTVVPPMTTQELLDRAYSGLPGSYRTSGSLQEAASTPGSQEVRSSLLIPLQLLRFSRKPECLGTKVKSHGLNVLVQKCSRRHESVCIGGAIASGITYALEGQSQA